MKKQSLYIAAAALVLASCASTGVKKSTEGYEAVSKEGFGTCPPPCKSGNGRSCPCPRRKNFLWI